MRELKFELVAVTAKDDDVVFFFCWLLKSGEREREDGNSSWCSLFREKRPKRTCNLHGLLHILRIRPVIVGTTTITVIITITVTITVTVILLDPWKPSPWSS